MDAGRVDFNKIFARQKAYGKTRLKWAKRASAETRKIELVVLFGGAVAGFVGGIFLGWSLGENVFLAGCTGLAGAVAGGLGGYIAIICLFLFLAPPEMAHAAKVTDRLRAERLRRKFDKAYIKTKQELDEATKSLEKYRNKRREKIEQLEAIRNDVQEFLKTRNVEGEDKASACAQGLAKHLADAIEHDLYAAPYFSKERYAMMGCHNTDALFRNVGSEMRHRRKIKFEPPWSYEKSLLLFQQHFIEDINKAIEIEQSFLPN